ncbi:MAG: DNA starvation/stationary phase protection protein [Vicingaceae bacterium]|nr:MAG: DNA starvation/stationary phase protection protein [Vicingaceae bacterium]
MNKKKNKTPNYLENSKEIADELNELLSDYQVFYMNVRGFHWNIKGEKFFELHMKFEELYNDLAMKIDEIAERIRTLGFFPLHTFKDYLENATVKPVKNLSEGKECVKEIVKALETILPKQHKILIMTEDTDESTNALMSDYLREQEKLLWMYRSYLGQ